MRIEKSRVMGSSIRPEHTVLHKSIEAVLGQLGTEAFNRYLPKGMRLHNCAVHGNYLAHYSSPADKLSCPTCSIATTNGNGTTATAVQHYIDMRDQVERETGYRPL